MTNSHTEILKKIESKVPFTSKSDTSKYRKYGKMWIKTGFNPKSPVFKNNEMSLYPSNNYKRWILWGLSKLRIKKNNITLSKLLGLKICLPFLKEIKLPLSADIIFDRFQNLVLIYDRGYDSKIIKVAVRDWGKVKINMEKDALKKAAEIVHHKVLAPKILFENENNEDDFFAQDFFTGRQLSFKENLSEIYGEVYDFLKKFYISNGVELKDINENKFVNHQFVEDYIGGLKKGKEVVDTYKKLLGKSKKMLWGWVHGDLSHHNILINDNQICIIDWGKSKYHYLMVDLDSVSYNTEVVFNDIISHYGFDAELLYSYNEQKFLKRYVEINRLVHNGIKRKTMTDTFYLWVERQNEILMSYSLENNNIT